MRPLADIPHAMTTTPAPDTVLLVEDEPLILIHSQLALEDAGFAVIVAADGETALATLDARPDIRALFTDVRLPGALDGLALARTARERRPDLSVVVTSGGAVASADLPSGGRFLAKPYTAGQVVRLLAA